jgi:hypothetical protein
MPRISCFISWVGSRGRGREDIRGRRRSQGRCAQTWSDCTPGEGCRCSCCRHEYPGAAVVSLRTWEISRLFAGSFLGVNSLCSFSFLPCTLIVLLIRACVSVCSFVFTPVNYVVVNYSVLCWSMALPFLFWRINTLSMSVRLNTWVKS